MGWWLQQKHIPSISNLIAQSRSVFKGSYVIVENPFPYEKVNGIFDFLLPEPDYCILETFCLEWFKDVRTVTEHLKPTLWYPFLKCVFFVEFRTLYKRVFTFHAIIICVNEVNYSVHIRHTLEEQGGQMQVSRCIVLLLCFWSLCLFWKRALRYIEYIRSETWFIY